MGNTSNLRWSRALCPLKKFLNFQVKKHQQKLKKLIEL